MQPPLAKKQDKEAKEYVLHLAKEKDVKFVRLWFTDILGALKGFAITVEDLEEALEQGKTFDGSAIQGFARSDESDMIAMPDPTTFAILPWRPKQQAVARLFCDILMPNGEPNEADPRHVLKRNLKRAAEMGYTYYVSPEMEYFYFKGAEGTTPLDEGGYFDLTPLDVATDLRRETALMLEDLGIGVEESHHEVAPSQHEIDLRYTDALTMADNVMTYRLVVKQVALEHGCSASFMPKPINGVPGSGMHVNQSLFRGETNIFYDAKSADHLSSTAKCFMAGLLRHAPEITAVTNQWVNSYKRLVPGYEAPVYVTWATTNRADLVRVPEYKPGRDNSTRVEYRAPDPACNPYLAFSVMLAAGLRGIQKEYPLPSAMKDDVFSLSDKERQRKKIGRLPANLGEAIRLAAQSQLLREALGDQVAQTFIKNKEIEWARFDSYVTDYELKRYLPLL